MLVDILCLLCILGINVVPRPHVGRCEEVFISGLAHVQSVVEELLEAGVPVGLEEGQAGGGQLFPVLLVEVAVSEVPGR